MPLANVKFDVSKLRAQFERLGRRARDFDNRLLTALLLESVEENFETQGSAGTDPKWAPLRPSTITRNPSRAGGKLLVDTGLLANFQSQTRQSVSSIVSSPAPYAKYHVTGTRNLRKRNPFAINIDGFMDDAERLIVLEIGR